MNNEVLNSIADVYELIIEAGVYKAPSIKVAEASKVIENTQRDINIAFMNELAMIFNVIDIDTAEVLKAASTKWNFLDFVPGLVGGHCIAVDPNYLIHLADKIGYHSQVIPSGRRINDGMARFVVENVIKQIVKRRKNFDGVRVLICGITFKANCNDTRNSGAISIIEELGEYGIIPVVYDPEADGEEAKAYYGIDLITEESLLSDIDCAIFTVAHEQFKTFNFKDVLNEGAVIIDIKSMFDREEMVKRGYQHWRL